MKVYRAFVAMLVAAAMVFATFVPAFAIAEFDEDGNIIEQEALEGGIVPAMADLDFGDDFAFPPLSLRDVLFSERGEVVGVEFLGDDVSSVRIVTGVYEDTGEDSVVVFNITHDTVFLGDVPEIGDVIVGFYDSARPVVMIYPPMYTAVVIVPASDYMVYAGRFGDDWVSLSGQWRLPFGLFVGGDIEIANGDDDDAGPAGGFQIVYEDGREFDGEYDELIGRVLVVEFLLATRDFPGTIRAGHITILFEPIMALPGDGEWEEIVTFPDIDWSLYQVVVETSGVPLATFHHRPGVLWPDFVSLRAIVEFLGETVTWNDATRTITVTSPRGLITLAIGSSTYTVAGQTYTLDAPIIVGSSTYVPIRFFRDVFGFNNAYWAGGTVIIDNGEVME